MYICMEAGYFAQHQLIPAKTKLIVTAATLEGDVWDNQRI